METIEKDQDGGMSEEEPAVGRTHNFAAGSSSDPRLTTMQPASTAGSTVQYSSSSSNNNNNSHFRTLLRGDANSSSRLEP